MNTAGRVDPQQCTAHSGLLYTRARIWGEVGHRPHGLPQQQPTLPGDLLDLVVMWATRPA